MNLPSACPSSGTGWSKLPLVEYTGLYICRCWLCDQPLPEIVAWLDDFRRRHPDRWPVEDYPKIHPGNLGRNEYPELLELGLRNEIGLCPSCLRELAVSSNPRVQGC